MLRIPLVAEAMSALGLVLRFNFTFELRLREFTILLTGSLLGLPVRGGVASDATYRLIEVHFGIAGTGELTRLIGYYAMIAPMLNAAEFEVPAGMAPLCC